MIRTRLCPRLAGVAVITAMVVSAMTLTLPSSPASAVPGQQVVTATSPVNSNNPKTVVATCPAGRTVIGTGAEILGFAGNVTVQTVLPAANNVTAVGRENHVAPTGPWAVRVYAICAFPVPRRVVVTATSPFNSVGHKNVIVTCPNARRVIGTGAEIIGGGGNVTLEAVRPLTATSAFAIGDREQHLPPTTNWAVRVYAICALQLPGQQVVTATSPVNSNNPKTEVATCPAGRRVIGTGAQILSGAGNVAGNVTLQTVRPAANNVTAVGRENHVAPTGPWAVRVSAICAT